MPDVAFTFDSEKHVYRLNGRVLPSVTKILEEWYRIDLGRFAFYFCPRTGQRIDATVWEAAQDRGTAVHRMLELCLTGQGVDRAALDPFLAPYLNQIEAWIDRYKPRVILAEKPLFHPEMMYAGTPDIFCECKGIKRPVLADGKSGQRGNVGAQTAGYEPLVRKETGFKGLIDRYVLDLKPEGYWFEPCGTAEDFTYFKMRLWAHNYERRAV